jgi:hypothetical protein
MRRRGYHLSLEHREKLSAARRKPIDRKKSCPRCRKVKPASAFGVRLGRPPGSHPCLKSYCQPCDRRYSAKRQQRFIQRHPEAREKMRVCNRRVTLARKHDGMALDEYDVMFAAQGGVCAICLRPPTVQQRKANLAVDHDHATGKRRSLLCNRCNLGLGYLDDDSALLHAAARYLESHAAQQNVERKSASAK